MILKLRKFDFKKILFPLVLAILVLVYLNKGVLMKGIFFGADEIASDILHFTYPYKEFITEIVKQGRIPLWNPYLAGGLPILAEAQTGIFFPLSMLLYTFFRPEFAYNWLLITCFIVVALGTYFYGRKIGLKPHLAFFAGAIFTLSGYMFGHLRHIPIITAMAFMPWMFLAVENIFLGKKYLWSILLALFIAFSFFAGHLSTTYEILIFLGFYFLLRLGKEFKVNGKESLNPIILFVSAVILGVIISAVQLLPSLELVKYSTRADLAATKKLDSGYAAKDLLMFVSPYIIGDPSRGTWFAAAQGNYWENVGYIGIFPLVLLIIGFFRKYADKDRYTLPIKIGFLIAFILMLGVITPVYDLLMKSFPGFSFTRISGRFILFVDFFGAVLAAFSLENLSLKFKKNILKIVIATVILISIADVFYFGYPFNTVMPFSYFDETESVKFIKKDTDLYRIKSPDTSSWVDAWTKSSGWRGDLSDYIDQREIIPPDLNLFYKIPSASLIYEMSGHFSVKRAGDLDAYASIGFLDNYVDNPAFAKLLGMENIKYVIGITDKGGINGLTQVKEYKTLKTNLNIRIYKNNYFLPRAYFVGKGVNFTSSQELLKALLDKSFEPSKEVYLEGATSLIDSKGRGEVKITDYKDVGVSLDANLKDSGYLVLSDTNYPGWHAYIDGVETKIYQANYNYRAIEMPAGSHKVAFIFKPESFRIGGLISWVGLGILTSGLLLLVYLRVHKHFSK